MRMLYKVEVINKEFLDQVQKSVKKLKLREDIYVEGYMVSLLSKFLKKEADVSTDEPLIYRLVKSKRLEDYVKLGDDILFITGFFPEVVERKKEKKYAISIGRGSYGQAAVILNYEGEGHVYNVLSKKFESYSDLINSIRYDMLELIDDKAFFEIYKTARDYKNPRASEKLKKTGTLTKKDIT
ncbi:hypothetical protein FJZ53_06115 [Candidatus Woesearchaeota archaeon]|nr:hypothetical protein [Candidatus Woesearchaeota archaeon]